MRNELELTVHVAADEWAYCQRRLTYLEALLLHVVRERRNIQEWYDAAELAALRLPGLPANHAAVSRKARAARWPSRKEGRCSLYHVTSLPARSFDALIGRILDLPEPDEFDGGRPLPDLPAEAAPAERPSETAAPAWVLPLMTLMRGEAKGSIAAAWRALPAVLPRGTILPSVDEAAEVLVELGLADKVANWSEH